MENFREFHLSERLRTIASEIHPGDRTADIGTDHGYIPIYLLLTGVTDRVILTDINEGPLIRAADNFRKWLPGVVPDLRQGPGLSVLRPGEADAVIIAGMGGILISRILDDAPETAASVSRFILQPRNHAYTLRNRIRKSDLFITVNEQIALESGRYCEIITLAGKDRASSEEWKMAERIREMENELGLEERIYDEVPLMYALTGKYGEYLEHKSRTEIRVIENILAHGRSEYAESRMRRAVKRMHALKKMKELQERMADNQ